MRPSGPPTVRVDPRLTDGWFAVAAGAERVVVECRLVITMSTGRGPLRAGSTAYVLHTHSELKPQRMLVLARSGPGEWREVWAAKELLRDFRAVTLPTHHSLHGDARLLPAVQARTLLAAPGVEVQGGSVAQVRAELDRVLAGLHPDRGVAYVHVGFMSPPPGKRL